jgi:hypothetical protein
MVILDRQRNLLHAVAGLCQTRSDASGREEIGAEKKQANGANGGEDGDRPSLP